MSRTVRVPGARVARWFENFGTRHGEVSCSVEDGRLVAVAADGAVARAALPFGREYGGAPDPVSFADAVAEPMTWGLVESPDENKLAYGVEDTDNVILMLACQPRSGEVLVTLVEHEDRAGGTMVLQAGRASSKRPAQAQPDESLSLASECRTDLLSIGDQPVGLSVTGTVGEALSREPLHLQACDPTRGSDPEGGVDIPAGRTLLETADGRETGIDVDVLTLASAAGGTAGTDTLAVAPGPGPGDQRGSLTGSRCVVMRRRFISASISASVRTPTQARAPGSTGGPER